MNHDQQETLRALRRARVAINRAMALLEQRHRPPIVRKRVTWSNIVHTALTNLGGAGHLSDIYNEAYKIAIQKGKPIPRHFKAVFRQTLERCSSDSRNYDGSADLFIMKGCGYWESRRP